ncbi:hypothetical protein DPMN_017220 [Dreissena polymorpha]|uniref:Uncharacterized protein n=1 Tax=Dreissena polymorpha TaxID=45954 RepID=A0A9D4NEG1_DREPO|nr:hypothetical protein DPMN_017220 [Dreissena polymorpha]
MYKNESGTNACNNYRGISNGLGERDIQWLRRGITNGLEEGYPMASKRDNQWLRRGITNGLEEG